MKIALSMKEVNPQETSRAYAFEMWMNAPMLENPV
jgi:chloramphenicol O-acetyltransferase type A